MSSLRETGTTQKIRIFFKGAPKKASLESVLASFQSFGQIRFFKMPFSQKNRCFMGYGHLAFVDDRVNEIFRRGLVEVRVEGILLEVGLHQRKQRSSKITSSKKTGPFSNHDRDDVQQKTQESEDICRELEANSRHVSQSWSIHALKILSQTSSQTDLWVLPFRPTQRQYFRARSHYSQQVDGYHRSSNMRFRLTTVSESLKTSVTLNGISALQ